MNLTIIRKVTGTNSVIGELAVNGLFECYTLEDVDRGLSSSMTLSEIAGIKIPAKTAIPKGRYEVAITFSERFKKPLPLLLNVPGYVGVRIHSGNTAADTEGCVLVGKVKGPDNVSQSRDAFNILFPKLQEALQTQKVFIEIS
jgi:hypothetical protein